MPRCASNNPGALWRLYKDVDTVSGTYIPGSVTVNGNPLFPQYSPDQVQTYGVLTAPFRFMPAPLDYATDLESTSIAPSPQTVGEHPFKIEQIKRPSEIILVMDASQIGNQGIAKFNSNTYLGTWAADADLNRIQGSLVQTQWPYHQNLLLYAESYGSVDAGLNKDYQTYYAMDTDTGPYSATGNDIRFRHMNNTQANALFADGHTDSFHFKHPGYGGTDLQYKNFILDDYRPGDVRLQPGQTFNNLQNP